MLIAGKIVALVVAAGSGSRAGDGIPKQFRMVDGMPMLRHSVMAFAGYQRIDAVFVVIAEGQLRDAQAPRSVAGPEAQHRVPGRGPAGGRGEGAG